MLKVLRKQQRNNNIVPKTTAGKTAATTTLTTALESLKPAQGVQDTAAKAQNKSNTRVRYLDKQKKAQTKLALCNLLDVLEEWNELEMKQT